MRVSGQRGFDRLERAAERVSKLEAVTVERGAAPSEAEFAARRARFIRDQFGLDGRNLELMTVTFSLTAPRTSGGPLPALTDPSAAAAAYGAQPADRRRSSALRFVELA